MKSEATPARFIWPAAALFFAVWGLSTARPPPPPDLAAERDREVRELAQASVALFNHGRYADAWGPTLRLQAAQPRSHIVAGRLADLAQNLKNTAEEVRWREEYMKLSPTPIEACPRIGQAYAELGKSAESLAAFERCYALDPKDPDMTYFLARADELANKLDRAGELYAEGLQRAPNYTDLAIGLARVRLRQGRTAEAFKLAQAAVARAPDYPDALLVYGMALLRSGKARAALEPLDKGAALRATDADFPLVAGIAREELGERAKALELYRRALELRPGDHDAQVRKARLERGP